MAIRIECPKCGKAFTAPDEAVGVEDHCPSCRTAVVVKRPAPKPKFVILPKNYIICPNPNCGYKGPSRKNARGSALLGLALLCLFIIPGLLYLIFMQGYRYYCPQCGLQVAVDN